MSTPTPLEAAALDALRSVIDPLTGQDWVSTRHLKSLTVQNGQARVEIALGYPARSQWSAYTALVDREQVGLGLCVIAEVNLSPHTEDTVQRFEREVAACPPIVSCYSTTGQSDYVMRVLVRDIKAYDRFLHDTVFKLPGVTHVRSSMVLREVKAQGRLPIEVPAGGVGG